MIDVHSHILNNVDDGSDSIENTIKNLKKAEKAGFSDIILTPHYIEDYYENKKDIINIAGFLHGTDQPLSQSASLHDTSRRSFLHCSVRCHVPVKPPYSSKNVLPAF